MPRPRTQKLKHTLHKASGRGFVRIEGKFFYTGPWGSQEAEDAFAQLNGKWIAQGRPAVAVTPPKPRPDTFTVSDLIQTYTLKHVLTHYRGPDGSETTEVGCIAGALRNLKAVFGDSPAAEFDALKLEQWREALADGRYRAALPPPPPNTPPAKLGGLCRTRINRDVSRVKGMFKWGVRQKLIPSTVHYQLLSVSGLRRFRGKAAEAPPVEAVEDPVIARTLPHLTPVVADMVRIHRLTGCRSGELIRMTPADIDRTGPTWFYRPSHHKGSHHGHTRTIPLVASAQQILTPYIDAAPDPSSPIFTTAASRTAMKRRRRSQRITPDSCGNTPNPSGIRTPATPFTVSSYGRAVHRASLMAQMPKELDATGRHLSRIERRELATRREAWLKANTSQGWHPHQLRHSVAKSGKHDIGLDKTRALLGHRTISMTEHYSGTDLASAIEGAEAIARGAGEALGTPRVNGPRLAV